MWGIVGSETPTGHRLVGLVDVAVLLTSELVTNAVLHAHSPIDVRVRHERGRLRVEVETSGQTATTADRPMRVFSDIHSARRWLNEMMPVP